MPLSISAWAMAPTSTTSDCVAHDEAKKFGDDPTWHTASTAAEVVVSNRWATARSRYGYGPYPTGLQGRRRANSAARQHRWTRMARDSVSTRIGTFVITARVRPAILFRRGDLVTLRLAQYTHP